MTRFALLYLLSACALLVRCCDADNITAYVREELTSTRCETVAAESDVCNIKWRVTNTAADDYNNKIQIIEQLIMSPTTVEGLNDTQAAVCRKEYARMTCRKYYPVCNMETLSLDYGNATALCQRAKNVCATIIVADDCGTVTTGKRSFVAEENRCVAIKRDASQICPNLELKVPKKNEKYTESLIPYLTGLMKTFDEKTRNITEMKDCASKYKEVLCRLIQPCSPDELYALYLIGKDECETMTSCAIDYDESLRIDLSICAILPPDVEKSKHVNITNPFFGKPGGNEPMEEKTTTPSHAETGEPTTTISKRTDAITEPIIRTEEILENTTPKPESKVATKPKNRASMEKHCWVGFVMTVLTLALLRP